MSLWEYCKLKPENQWVFDDDDPIHHGHCTRSVTQTEMILDFMQKGENSDFECNEAVIDKLALDSIFTKSFFNNAAQHKTATYNGVFKREFGFEEWFFITDSGQKLSFNYNKNRTKTATRFWRMEANHVSQISFPSFYKEAYSHPDLYMFRRQTLNTSMTIDELAEGVSKNQSKIHFTSTFDFTITKRLDLSYHNSTTKKNSTIPIGVLGMRLNSEFLGFMTTHAINKLEINCTVSSCFLLNLEGEEIGEIHEQELQLHTNSKYLMLPEKFKKLLLDYKVFEDAGDIIDYQATCINVHTSETTGSKRQELYQKFHLDESVVRYSDPWTAGKDLDLMNSTHHYYTCKEKHSMLHYLPKPGVMHEIGRKARYGWAVNIKDTNLVVVAFSKCHKNILKK